MVKIEEVFAPEDLDRTLTVGHGLWITVIWSDVCIKTEDKKNIRVDIFFALIEKWLREGRIKFYSPNEAGTMRIVGPEKDYAMVSTFRREPDTNKPFRFRDKLWDADVATIVQRIRANWPPSAIEENDMQLEDYFHDSTRCPCVVWYNEAENAYACSAF